MTTPEPAPAQRLSPRTVQTYAQDWALFTDWCAATSTRALPAAPDTMLRFLTACPATRSTQRCRVAAIDHHHAGAGMAKPGESPLVRAALGRPLPDQGPAPQFMPDPVAAALHGLPSHGWTSGMFGRRDRCLLVLSQLAGLPYKELALLTVGMVTVADGAARISAAGAATLTASDSPMMCGPCAVARWQRVLNVATTKVTTRAVALSLKKARAVTDRSTHVCRSDWQPDQRTGGVWLFPPIDQWGALPFPIERLTPHSLSRRVRDPLAGDFGAHRPLEVDADEEVPTRPGPVVAPAVSRVAYTRSDWQKAWARRRADIQRMAGIGDELAELDRRADELNQRADALLANDQ